MSILALYFKGQCIQFSPWECSFLFGPLLLDLSPERLNPLFEIEFLSFQLFILSKQLLDIGISWLAKTLLNELNDVAWLLLLLVEAHEHLGQLVNHPCLLQVLSELVLLLLRGLYRHLSWLDYFADRL